MMNADTELLLLNEIHSASREGEAQVTQRILAQTAGLSLGMTNALLKRLLDRGWLAVTRLNARNIRYLVTPDGLAALAKRGQRYMRRNAENLVSYREAIEALVLDKKREGCSAIVLAGESDLDFILEYACERHGLVLVKSADVAKAESLAGRSSFLVYSERYEGERKAGAIILSEVLAE